MSINMDTDDTGTDYSDFEYQHLSFRLQDQTGSDESNPNVDGFAEYDVLGQVGGLDTNEIAELVYARLTAHLEFESETNDQDVGSSSEFRGVFGANLPTNSSIEVQNETNRIDGTTVANSGADGDFDVIGDSQVEDRIFEQFRVDGGPSFDDATNGPGGGRSGNHFAVEKNWRSLTGRGPVLDSSDELSIAARLVSADSIINVTGNVRAHLVFDTAEVSDAGRAFSVPMDD